MFIQTILYSKVCQLLFTMNVGIERLCMHTILIQQPQHQHQQNLAIHSTDGLQMKRQLQGQYQIIKP